MAAMERTFENPEAYRRTQMRAGPDGAPVPDIAPAAMSAMLQDSTIPDYAAVRAPALAVAYVPQHLRDMFMGVAEPSPAWVAGTQRIIYGGIAGFVEGMGERGTIVALQNSQHNIHLASPDELEQAMRSWLADVTARR